MRKVGAGSPVVPGRVSRAVWLLPLLLGTAIAAGVVWHGRGRTARTGGGAAEEAGGAAHGEARPSAEEVRRLEGVIIALDHRVSALEAAARHGGGAAGAPAPGSETAKVKDARSPAERHRDTLRSFDAVLAMDRGDARDRRTAAEALRRELAEAAQGKVQVLDVECGTEFCKATIEEDSAGGHPPLDMTAFIDATPSLKTEAMFDYQTEGTRKRTTVYAARAGQLLPTSRAPLPELSGVAAAAPSRP